MAKLPNSWKAYNRTTRQFRVMYGRLPREIQQLTRGCCQLFHRNPDHPSLRRHVLTDRRSGKHRLGSVSISITLQYRAIYVEQDGVNIWYWIGTHSEYDSFTGKK